MTHNTPETYGSDIGNAWKVKWVYCNILRPTCRSWPVKSSRVLHAGGVSQKPSIGHILLGCFTIKGWYIYIYIWQYPLLPSTKTLQHQVIAISNFAIARTPGLYCIASSVDREGHLPAEGPELVDSYNCVWKMRGKTSVNHEEIRGYGWRSQRHKHAHTHTQATYTLHTYILLQVSYNETLQKGSKQNKTLDVRASVRLSNSLLRLVQRS